MSLRERLFQVYTYLQELSRLRNPVVCEIKEYTWIRSLAGLRRHPSLTIHLNSDKETDVFLEVRRPDLTHPSHLLVDADPAAGTGGHTQDVMRLYEDLYELKTRLDREAESYELILGDGILDWPINETTRIYHPIILQKVRLEFDPAVPEFAIVKTEQPPELYSTVLSAHTSVSALVIRSLRQIMEQRGIGPANGERTSNYLREIASQISPRGLFMDDGMPEGRPDAPQITRSPILFLRRRTMGLGLALQAILDDIGQRAEFPQSIARIVGVDAVDNQLREREFDKGRSVPDRERDYDEDILFTKEANLEQRQIARRLDRFGAVLVQGPPGTGKTHTIANLLGHLLAQGKTVLVTAHTEKALKVLRDKVVDPLKPLCVSMLSDDRNYMEAAVDAIIDRLSQSDAGELERAALKLARERLELIRELEAATEQLAEARADEYRPISIAGSNYAPSTAARMVRESRLAYSWIPGQVPTGVPMPLSEAEINQLYRTNTLIVSPDAEDSFETLEPGSLQPDKIPSPAEIEKIVREKKRLSSENFWHHKEYWSDPPGDQTPEKLDSLLLSLVKATETISNSPDWLLAVLEAGKEKSYLITTWGDLLLQIKNADELALEATTAIYRTDADIPRHLLAGRAERALNEIIGFLERGNQLNSFKLFLNKEWREIIESARINRKHPSTIGDFHTLRLILQFNRSRAELLDRWKRQVTTLGGPAPEDLGPEPEKTCRQFIPLIRQKLVWHTAISGRP